MNIQNKLGRKLDHAFKNNRILLWLRDSNLLEKTKVILKDKYVLDTINDFNKNKINTYDLIIVDQKNYKKFKTRFSRAGKQKKINFIPSLLIVNKRIKEGQALPAGISEIINLPLVKSVFLNRVKLLINFKNDFFKNQRKLNYLLYHDDLTDMYNRKFLNEYLDELKNKELIPISFIAANIDSLKTINKKFGYNFGDKIVKKTAKILAKIVNDKDYVIRIGGDEFLIILLGESLIKAERIVEKIEIGFYNNFINKIKVSLGIGVAAFSKPTQNIENVITTAMSNMYLNKLSKEESTKHRVITSMINTLEAKSYETYDHAERMKKLAVDLGKRVNLNKREIDELKLLSDLHDLGKVAIPENILKKPTKLTKAEFEIIKKHPQIGYEIVKTVPELDNVGRGVLSHHERWDGKGYPQGLKGVEIPILARIITIIDAFDVMRHERAYKKAYSYSYTINELKSCAGSQFDPYLVAEFLKIISQQRAISNKLLMNN